MDNNKLKPFVYFFYIAQIELRFLYLLTHIGPTIVVKWVKLTASKQ